MKQYTWMTLISHFILKRWCDASDRRFKREFNDLKNSQCRKLEQILSSSCLTLEHKIRTYEQFKQHFPPSRYFEWRDLIEQNQQGKIKLIDSKLVRFQPTSGSSEQIKFIPYTTLFLEELDHAITPWLSSMYRKNAQLRQGTHYWSVSWLPESQRQTLKDANLNDDSALLGLGKRILSKFTQAVPSNVALAARPEDALFATICYLVSDANLAMISVWSPTFALQLLDLLEQNIDEVIEVLSKGDWGTRQVSLENIKAPFNRARAQHLKHSMTDTGLDFKRLWPKLCLISSWDTAGSKAWAKTLQTRLPFVQFEGKGLWATEGVVTIPHDHYYPLAYQSHFYEFEYLQGEREGQIVPSWELKLGDVVSPIMTSGNGLLRYCLDDCLKVNHFLGQIPCFEFQGRRFGVDLVGEKLAPEMAHQLLKQLTHDNQYAVSLLAVDTQQQAKPFYCVLFEGEITASVNADYIDQLLKKHFHYELARDLGQLDVPQFRQTQNGWEAYKQLVMRDGMIEGNIKPEPLKKITLSSLQQLG